MSSTSGKSVASAKSVKSSLAHSTAAPPSPSVKDLRHRAPKHSELCKKALTKASKERYPISEASLQLREWDDIINDPNLKSDTSNSVPSVSSVAAGRDSLLPKSARHTGSEVPLDQAAKHINELFQKGKEALEQTGNKKEHRTIAIECMQGMYETCLSLADSRLRHKLSLEREQGRHAQELIVIERAHNKMIAEMNNKFITQLALSRETSERDEPSEDRLRSLEDANKKLEEGLIKLTDMASEIKESHARTQIYVTGIKSSITDSSKLPVEIDQKIADIKASISKIAEKSSTTKAPSIREEIRPISDRLEVVTKELKKLHEQSPKPQAVGAGTEMALKGIQKNVLDIKDQLTKKSYAQIASTPVAKESHTIIISSSNSDKTCDNVVEDIKQAMDFKATGIKVSKVRKAKNQKVVISCPTLSDLSTVKKQIQNKKELKVEEPKINYPLIRIPDVCSYHTDGEIVEHILAQNKELFEGVDLKKQVLRVRYRKRARNPLECHPVLEVSPLMYRKLTERGHVYVGLQRRPVLDQTPLVQCTQCLEYGHTRGQCQSKDHLCGYCGGAHTWSKCPDRLEKRPATCKNCLKVHGKTSDHAHHAFSTECRERRKWDAIARSRISYC